MGVPAFTGRPLHSKGTQRHHSLPRGVWFGGDNGIRHHAGGPFKHWLQRHGHPRWLLHLCNILLLISGLLGIALAYGYTQRMGIERGEYYTLLLFSVSGMMLMAQAADLIIVFLALELLSIPLYVLAAFTRKLQSEEAGVKYFLLGAFATGFVVYGTALIYGATGVTSLSGIFFAASQGTSGLLLSIGAALILVGFGFKVAAVPFHMWTPDVYQGAPTSVTAFMSSGAKIAGFVALLRVFATAFPSISADMTSILWVMSAIDDDRR
jgi:NADH-quinone oxidoreductase subunit N